MSDLENRVVSELKARRLIRQSKPWRTIAAALAAGIILFAGGVVTGRSFDYDLPDARPTFLLLLQETASFERGTPADETRRVGEYRDWAISIARRGQLVAGEKLHDGSVVLTSQGTASAEQSDIGGYFVIRAEDVSEATRIASSCPHVGYGGRVVVREIQREARSSTPSR